MTVININLIVIKENIYIDFKYKSETNQIIQWNQADLESIQREK